MHLPLYIHIPFCRKKCDYCDFYSLDYDRALAVKYIEVIIGQIKKMKEEGYSFRTVYIGGGTPSVLDECLLEALLVSLNLSDVEEATLEANPESLTESKLKLIRCLGVNRLSIGIQSFYDNILKFLGRIHNKKDALSCLESAIKAGFRNIGIDLIYGVPFKSLEIWKDELNIAVRFSVKHISLYSLTYEKNTPLYKRLKIGQFKPVSQEEEVKMYSYALRFLESKGFYQYEVSNFSKRGFESKHNLSYWANNQYLGLGPSTARFLNGVRAKFVDNLFKYIAEAQDSSEADLFIEQDELKPLERAKETAALNIRRKKGINFKEFRKKTGFDFLEIEKQALDMLKEQRLIVFKKKNSRAYGLRLNKKGFLFCDRVSRELL